MHKSHRRQTPPAGMMSLRLVPEIYKQGPEIGFVGGMMRRATTRGTAGQQMYDSHEDHLEVALAGSRI
jgi:hypothetical protein